MLQMPTDLEFGRFDLFFGKPSLVLTEVESRTGRASTSGLISERRELKRDSAWKRAPAWFSGRSPVNKKGFV